LLWLTIIRAICLMLIGVSTYSILLWVFGWRMPGRLRRIHRLIDNKSNKQKAIIIFGYYLLLGSMILVGFLLIKYRVRGGL
jgi:uncharacterized membrane protein